ncbi:hypothetical protein NKI48_01425 [Mesorhizobium sp. M0644]|uniref:hypothetical protein n=1 Tax=Mesorhizobium sp. M0644 TaxID=2956979 RepID=UPI00333D0BF3
MVSRFVGDRQSTNLDGVLDVHEGRDEHRHDVHAHTPCNDCRHQKCQYNLADKHRPVEQHERAGAAQCERDYQHAGIKQAATNLLGSPNGRILRLRDNPKTKWTGELERCPSECQAGSDEHCNQHKYAGRPLAGHILHRLCPNARELAWQQGQSSHDSFDMMPDSIERRGCHRIHLAWCGHGAGRCVGRRSPSLGGRSR